ncbi:hypothetical protein [Lysobacter xanthus]
MRLHTLFRLSDVLGRFDRPLRGAARAVLEPRKPRHRVLRAALALAGLVVLGLLVVAALAIGTVLILGSLGWRLLRPRGAAAPARSRVLDGAYRVVPRPMLSR